ncbi:MAG TPA: hypothetical protein VFM10_13260 [Terriglobales bacterium]|nr:hypothetical protein [Terriglobales bacterium]
MKLEVSKLVRLGALTLAVAVIPTVLPASAQTNNNMDTNPSATATEQNSSMVPGTGMTVAELRDLGYTQNQIDEIRSTELAQTDQNTNPATASNTNNAATNPNAPQANNPATGGGGGGWGLWGLVGLLGLLGLTKGRRRAESVDRDRDIRRVA